MNNSKGVIIAVFTKKNKILSTFEELRNYYGVKSDKIFVYSIDTNNAEYLITFKTYDKNKFIGKLKGATVMHVKNGCLFSINALNKLIDKLQEDSNTPNNEYVINWNDYKDKLIILTNGELSISNLNKIEDKSTFFV